MVRKLDSFCGFGFKKIFFSVVFLNLLGTEMYPEGMGIVPVSLPPPQFSFKKVCIGTKVMKRIKWEGP